ncbi:hypothetical protein [Escherichia phage phiWec190]|nr:hypothetical protein [Escherichia phage phiWec188]BDU13849.1 hypothetical protein [Escherichia phage phiWec190]
MYQTTKIGNIYHDPKNSRGMAWIKMPNNIWYYALKGNTLMGNRWTWIKENNNIINDEKISEMVATGKVVKEENTDRVTRQF